jgi:hypothetical protein
MTRDPIAEIDTCPQGRWVSIRSIRQPRQEAPYATDRRANCQRDGKQIASRRFHADPPLCRFHRNQTTDKAADNRFSSQEKLRVAPVLRNQRWNLEPDQHATPHGGSDESGRHDRPSRQVREAVALAASQPQVYLEAARIGEDVEDQMRVQPPWTEVKIDGKVHTGCYTRAHARCSDILQRSASIA